MVRSITVLLFLALLSSAAHAQKRVALVIGNSAYKHAGTLANPKNDATDISAALKKLGFQVIEGFDLDKAAFDRKVRDFSAALKGAEAGLFFYAGHGLQVAGRHTRRRQDCGERSRLEADKYTELQGRCVSRS